MREQSAIILWLWICYCFSYLSHLSFVFHFFQPSLVWTLFLNSFYLPSYILGIKLLLLLWLQSMGLQKLDMTQPSATKQQHTALGCHKASFLSFFFFFNSSILPFLPTNLLWYSCHIYYKLQKYQFYSKFSIEHKKLKLLQLYPYSYHS